MNYKTLAWCHLRAIRSMSEVVIVKHGRVAKLMRNGLDVEIAVLRAKYLHGLPLLYRFAPVAGQVWKCAVFMVKMHNLVA